MADKAKFVKDENEEFVYRGDWKKAQLSQYFSATTKQRASWNLKFNLLYNTIFSKKLNLI
tara:strand:+ start:274 stop:453 length:180 start_codon:yes stop_codon:yes gene_type:complete